MPKVLLRTIALVSAYLFTAPLPAQTNSDPTTVLPDDTASARFDEAVAASLQHARTQSMIAAYPLPEFALNTEPASLTGLAFFPDQAQGSPQQQTQPPANPAAPSLGDLGFPPEQTKDLIAHVHTAGNPGRAELDDKQEINYPPIMRKLLELKYTGYVGQEFIPTRNPLEGLKEAGKLWDV